MKRQAVFIDRDGVLIRDVHRLRRLDQIELYECAPRAIRRLQMAGLAVVVVSNQAVVARGLATEQDVERTHAELQRMLRVAGGGKIDRFYFCPHHPDATLPYYRVDCNCRKPRPGMLLRAAQELTLDLRNSFMVGDRLSDVLAGLRAGCSTILVETGMHTAPWNGLCCSPEVHVKPHHTCADLEAAADFVLERVL